MHCISCDKLLSDFESTRKHAVTGEYLDICNRCFKEIPVAIPTIDRKDLILEEEIDDEDPLNEDSVWEQLLVKE